MSNKESEKLRKKFPEAVSDEAPNEPPTQEVTGSAEPTPSKLVAVPNAEVKDAPKPEQKKSENKNKFENFIDRIKKSKSNPRKGRSRSHSKLSFRNISNLVLHKRHVNDLPPDFDKWAESDKRMYYETSLHFRLFKCDQWQCAPIQQRLSRFTVLWRVFRNPTRRKEHQSEMAQYRKTVQLLQTNPINKIELEF